MKTWEFVNHWLSLIGWLMWAILFWIILLTWNENGYYINPFLYDEFWIEFVMINIIITFNAICVLKAVKKYLKKKGEVRSDYKSV